MIANARTCKGVPFVDLFLQFFQKDCKKKTAVFKKGLFLILQRFALLMLLKNMHPQLKTIQPQLETKRKQEKKMEVRQKGCF